MLMAGKARAIGRANDRRRFFMDFDPQEISVLMSTHQTLLSALGPSLPPSIRARRLFDDLVLFAHFQLKVARLNRFKGI
jgi:hypothetical protein